MKSRSGGSKGSRSNSVENEDSSNHQSIEPLQSLAHSMPETPITDSNCLAIRNESTIPSSPPPSYEHVLEETRLEQSEDTREKEEEEEDEEEDEEEEEEEKKNRRKEEEKGETAEEGERESRRRGGDGSGGGGGGGDGEGSVDNSSFALEAGERARNGIRIPAKGPEILHKSSKEFYRAMAKQWGITCKMSDHCRCLDCQSHYFDCEYEREENDKTDGGLGAGTPMFISEVMHGTACALL